MLDKVLNRAAMFVGACCLVAVVATISLLAARSLQTGTDARLPPSYAAGEKIDIPSELYTSADRTLLVFARSTCAACQSSKGILSSMVASATQLDSVAVAMVVDSSVGRSDPELRFAAEIGVSASQLRVVDTASLRLKRVPAVALVATSGEVLQFWEGSMDGDALDRIFGSLGVSAVPAS